jgi:hypothetical protein
MLVKKEVGKIIKKGFGSFLFTYYMYIAIPTYNRSDVLEKKTLTTLLSGGIKPSQIYIFVANQKEKQLYESIPSSKYNTIVVGKLGIANQRNFIKHYFKEGDHVVSIDDDVEGLYKLQGQNKLTQKLTKVKDISAFFISAFDHLKKENKYLWGIYPVHNPYFMNKKVSTDLSFIIGALHGYIVRHDKTLEPSVLSEGKEDYEQSILYYLKDGGVIRFNNITIKTKFLAAGGLGKDRFERNKKSAKYLQKKYPKLVTIFHRKNGMTEIKLTRKLRE